MRNLKADRECPLKDVIHQHIVTSESNGVMDSKELIEECLIKGMMKETTSPIMFSAGIGQIDHTHITKGEPEIGMLVEKIGGPAYGIGMGGGEASSMVSGQNDAAELDFNDVQRGDADMEQELYRVVRACIEMGVNNPIISIQDQGARGNCNVVKEIIYPEGATIDIRAIVVGDHTMSVFDDPKLVQNGSETKVSGGIWEAWSDGMDQVSIHQRFLHSNAISYKWFIEDNGGGMDPDKMQQCMSLGYSLKNKVANIIGQYKNSFKTSIKSLGAAVIGDQWVQYRIKGKQDGPGGKGCFKCGSLDHEMDVQFDTFEWKPGWSTGTCRKLYKKNK